MQHKPKLAKGVHPIVRRLHTLTCLSDKSAQNISLEAGLSNGALYGWFSNGVSPSLSSIDSAFKVLGYELKIQELENATA